MNRPLIVFDLDGTLIDSRLDLANSANEMLASYGASPRPVDDIAGMVGEGARVLVAPNGLDALQVLQSRRPDAILLDLMMPVMDGFTFARRLSRDRRWSAIRRRLRRRSAPTAS